ncbi:hypothetical protein AAG570_001172 [Ranatra chinensis]|uniref:Uncharacterized protein n=1 Tax=Ranatra chinensis TaxID=642074 RepID=A0ABD0YB39_9HEMI
MPDYTDLAYREAVSKLKYLLAESYTPITPMKRVGMMRGAGGSGAGPLALAPSSQSDSQLAQPPPAELISFIDRQEEYIEQLEKESQFCREELSNMMAKVKDVIAENGESGKRTTGGRHHVSSKILTGPSIMLESRISELEAQLTQCRLELRKAQEEATTKISTSMPSESVLPTPLETSKQIEELQRERNELIETVNNLQSLVTQLREKEASATQKVKRSLDVVDQAQFEKNQLEMEVRRLKSELERVNEKQRESLQDANRRVSEAERRYAVQVERLNADLAAQWDTTNRLNLELDRAKRTEQELRRELAQRNTTIEELKKEMSSKTSSLQSEALSAGAERESLEAELGAARLALERTERGGRQEAARLQAEVASLRQRLDRADADLLHSRKENIRLNENVSMLEKELSLAKLTKESKEAGQSKESRRDEELTSMIRDIDAKHVQSVAELEGMIQSQTQLMEKLKDECHTLTKRLEDSSTRHK